MKKKIIISGVVLTSVFVFSGCGKENKPELNIKTGDVNSISSGQNETKENVENKIQNQAITENQQQVQTSGGRFGEGFEAGISACESKVEGDGCQFSFKGMDDNEEKKINGICKKSPQSEELSCRPEMKDRLIAPVAE